jgi:hypothetical protein
MKNRTALTAAAAPAAGLAVDSTFTAAIVPEPGTEPTCGRLTSGATMADNPTFRLVPNGPVATTASAIPLGAPSAKGALR